MTPRPSGPDLGLQPGDVRGRSLVPEPASLRGRGAGSSRRRSLLVFEVTFLK